MENLKKLDTENKVTESLKKKTKLKTGSTTMLFLRKNWVA